MTESAEANFPLIRTFLNNNASIGLKSQVTNTKMAMTSHHGDMPERENYQQVTLQARLVSALKP
ncbi:hypothetical protein [Escherichia coli]|uniref:hypothetical protein n=1 Tax=Escherichia coli TaxID=562 RepID=UPI003890D236